MKDNSLEYISADATIYTYDVGAQGQPKPYQVAVEAPVEIAFGGVSFAVMMGTPTCLEDFSIGFALTEGIIESYDEVRAVDITSQGPAKRVNVTLSSDRMRVHLARKRATIGRTSCGICGIENLDQLPNGRAVVPQTMSVSPAAIGTALRALELAQPLNQMTRAVHGAAWCERDGSIRLMREDVGRHNALDKCIGALFRLGSDPSDGFPLITSRCSFEMVTKIARFGANTLVSISAPTSLAIERARECGIELIVTARLDHAIAMI